MEKSEVLLAHHAVAVDLDNLAWGREDEMMHRRGKKATLAGNPQMWQCPGVLDKWHGSSCPFAPCALSQSAMLPVHALPHCSLREVEARL